VTEFVLWSPRTGKPVGYLDESNSETLGIMQRAGYILWETEEL
jgi:hypothetical protein